MREDRTVTLRPTTPEETSRLDRREREDRTVTIALAPLCPRCHAKRLIRDHTPDGDRWACLSCGHRQPLESAPTANAAPANGRESMVPLPPPPPSGPAPLDFSATVQRLLADLEAERTAAHARIAADQDTVTRATQQIRALARVLQQTTSGAARAARETGNTPAARAATLTELVAQYAEERHGVFVVPQFVLWLVEAGHYRSAAGAATTLGHWVRGRPEYERDGDTVRKVGPVAPPASAPDGS